jgi:hypothetical protein
MESTGGPFHTCRVNQSSAEGAGVLRSDRGHEIPACSDFGASIIAEYRKQTYLYLVLSGSCPSIASDVNGGAAFNKTTCRQALLLCLLLTRGGICGGCRPVLSYDSG